MRLGHALAQTRVVPESLAPDWNETFTFGEAEVGAAIAAGGRLVFEVWDRDYATLDDFMGQARPLWLPCCCKGYWLSLSLGCRIIQ